MNIENFLATLPMMGEGMMGVFLVTGLIALLVALLNKFSPGSRDKK